MKCSPVTGFAYGLEPSLLAVPDVRPADPAAAVRLRDQVRAVGPGVDQDAVQVRDPAVGQRLDHARVRRSAASHSWNSSTVMFGCPSGWCSQRGDALLAERDARLVDRAVVPVPADHDGLAGDRVAGGEVA